MAEIRRRARAVWKGDLKGGNGRISSTSGVLKDVAYSFKTRFENEPGTNPDELLAAAHASCFSMAFANELSNAGYRVESIETEATCILESQPAGGFAITTMRLKTEGRVAGIDAATFEQIGQQAKAGCPVSGALRALKIELDATLL